VAGRVVFEGVSPPPQTVMVSLRSPPPVDLQTAFSNQATNSRAGVTFAIDGVMPGRFVFDAVERGNSRSSWILKRIMTGGRDVLDLPIDLAAGGGLDDVVITFTDRASTTEVSGTLTDITGRPATDAIVVVFPADDRYWREGSRHVRTGLPDAKGHYALAGLPPGDYLAASLSRDVGFGLATILSKLVPTAVRFSLADGEHKVVDVRRAR
jgi:hypothetical protein